MNDQLHVACLQINSSDSMTQNLELVSELIRQASEAGASLMLLPENFAWMGSKGASFNTTDCSVATYFLSECAKKQQTWIVAGSMPWPATNSDPRLYNRSMVIDPTGKICESYDKLHLFEAILEHEQWREADRMQAGSSPAMVALDDTWKVGLSICYDLRFPELYRHYSAHGCNILTVPSAFTVPTGQAHWEVLLRARAIENQCYLLAAGQVGEHADGRQTYGHSMIIDPWGTILSELPEGEGFIQATLSLSNVQAVRKKIPALQHRRGDL